MALQLKTVRHGHRIALNRRQGLLGEPVRHAETHLEATGQRNDGRVSGMRAHHRIAVDRLGAKARPALDHLGPRQHRCKRPGPRDQRLDLVVGRKGIVEAVLTGTADRGMPAFVRNDVEAVEIKQRQRRVDIALEKGRLPLDRLPERATKGGPQSF